MGTLSDLTEPITKLIETISGGIGKIYEPFHIKRIADAKSYEIQTIRNTISDNISLPISYEDGSISMNNQEIKDIIERAQNRFLFQELQKQQNIDAVVAGAYHVLEKEIHVSPEPVKKDWIIRFFNSVEDISDIQLQELWSKILAGEIRNPNSFSARALNTLRNITHEEANLFNKICKNSIQIQDKLLVFSDPFFMSRNNISYSDILLLDECGLISSTPYLTMEVSRTKDQNILLSNKEFIIFATPNSNDDFFTIQHYPFTSIGVELAQLNERINKTNLLLLTKIIREQNKNFDFALHQIKEHLNDDNQSIKIDPTDLITGKINSSFK